MARIRTIKPSFFCDLTMADLPVACRLTYIGLWTYVDDYGYGVDDARLVKAAVWPVDDDYPSKIVEEHLVDLAGIGRICRYETAGRRYFHVVRWEHQIVNRPTASVIPHCTFSEHSLKTHGGLTEWSVNVLGAVSENSLRAHVGLTDGSRGEGKGKERKGRERSVREGNGRRVAATPSARRPPPPGEETAAAQTAAHARAEQIRNNPCSDCGGQGMLESPIGMAMRCATCDGAGYRHERTS